MLRARLKKCDDWFKKYYGFVFLLGVFVGVLPFLAPAMFYNVSPSVIFDFNKMVIIEIHISRMIEPNSTHRDMALEWSKNSTDNQSKMVNIFLNLRRMYENNVSLDMNSDNKTNCLDVSIMFCNLLRSINLTCYLAVTHADESGHAFNIVLVNPDKYMMVDVSMGQYGSALVMEKTVVLKDI